MASGNYVPISCDDHDILELAIMGGEKLRVRFDGEHDSHLITPLELSARNGEEFLRYRGTGGIHEIRLDKMKEFHRELGDQPMSDRINPASATGGSGGTLPPTRQ